MKFECGIRTYLESIHGNFQQYTVKPFVLLNKMYFYSESKYDFLANRAKILYVRLIRIITMESTDIFT